MIKKLTFVFVLILSSALTAFSQDFKFYPDRFFQLSKSSEIASGTGFPFLMPLTESDKYGELVLHPSYMDTKYKFKNVENIVKIGINHDTGVVTSAYKYQVNLEISCYNYLPGSTVDVKYATLEFSYNPDSLQRYTDLALYRFTGYHAIRVSVTNVMDISGGFPVPVSSAAVARNFYIQSIVTVQRYDLTAQKILSDCSYLSASNDLNIEWGLFDAGSGPCVLPSVLTANNYKPVTYELEWCYIDDYQYNLSSNTSSYAFSTPGNINYDFRHNSTRVQISNANSFKIPLLYEHGAVIFRLRTIRPDFTHYKDIEYGDWSLADAGVIDASSSCFPANGYIITNAHQHDSLNWQYTVNFAEEGKYKHVINYFDGSLKDRQTQTKINSDNNYIVAVDKVYDYEGRPSLVSLPTPVYGQNDLHYRSDVLLHTITGKPYRAQDFDFTGCSQPDSIGFLSSSSLANIYYSPLNPDQAGMQKFVPDAKGYPVVQTVYSPDNTNKVLWQGGAGYEQQIWNGHPTQYEYSRPAQNEIDKYLGTEVGFAQYYPKQVVTDPNGQSSYSILDPAGKVVISGLQGPAPDKTLVPIDTLTNFIRGKNECDNLLEDYTQDKKDNKVSAQLPVYNDNAGDATFKYSVLTIPFFTGCDTQYLWADGVYNYNVINNCGVKMTEADGMVGEIKVTKTNGSSYATTSTTVYGMPKGNYQVNKTLAFSEYDIHHLVDSFVFANEPDCYNDVRYFVKEAIDSTKFPCAGFVDTNSSHCDMMKKLMKRDLYPGGKYGRYTKGDDSEYVSGDNNSIFKYHRKLVSTVIEPTEANSDYLARVGYNMSTMTSYPINSLDSTWKLSWDDITYRGSYPDGSYGLGPVVEFDLGSLPGYPLWGSALRHDASYCHAGTIDYGAPPGPSSKVYFKGNVYIDSSISLGQVYGRGSIDDNLISIRVNGVDNALDYGGRNFAVQGFHYGDNDVVWVGINQAWVCPSDPLLVGGNTCRLAGFIVNSDTLGYYSYQDTCIHLPDSIIKDGVVYKDLKNLPTKTLVEIFNDEIAEALLPLHPEYCKLQNCNDANFEQMLEETIRFEMAEKNNMFYLDSLVAHDPLVLLGGGVVTAERLKYMKNMMGVRLDTLAMRMAYCGAGNGEEQAFCTAKNFKAEIDNFIFLNDDIKQSYFSNLKSLYIGNRTLIKIGKFDSTASSCARCSSARLTQYGNPVFPPVTTSYTSGSSAGTANFDAYPSWMRDLFKKAGDGDTTGMSSVPGPLRDSFNKINLAFAETQAQNLLEHLKNCTLNDTKRTQMYNAVVNVIKSGRKLTPDIVKSIITDTVALSLSDLCHPFLVAYDVMPDTRPFSVAFGCGEDQLYTDFLSFIQRSEVVNEIKAATTTVSAGTTFAIFPYHNKFEELFSSGTDITISTYMNGVSPVCSNCYVNLIVSSDIKTDTFTITPHDFRAQQDYKALLNSTSPSWSINNVRCINDEPKAMATGFVARNTAVIDVTCSMCIGNSQYYIWSAHTPLMSEIPLASSLKNSITCLDIRDALNEFNTEQSTYLYSDATNHPLYENTITNYLNHKLNKEYYLSDYLNLMEGCAVTDQVQLKKLTTTYRLECSSDAYAESFITALHTYGTFKPDYFRYKLSGGNPVLFINLTTVPRDTILAYKNFMDAYTTGVVSRNYNYTPSDNNTALIFSDNDCTFNPSGYAPVYNTQNASVWENDTYNGNYKLHTFRLSGSPSALDEANLIAEVEKYMHKTTLISAPSCNVNYNFYGRTLMRSTDYDSDLKQEYLAYVYSLTPASHDAAIAELDPENLKSNIPSFSDKMFTYNDPYCRGSRTHLYAYDPEPATMPKMADKVKDVILGSVGSTIFPDRDFTRIDPYGSYLSVIRKANGDYWYRYFDNKKTLYNVFIVPPDRQLGINPEDYTFSTSDFQLGPHPNTFTIYARHSSGDKVLCYGYADFKLTDKSYFAENVILDKDPEGVFCFDSMDCEKELMARAILNGKAAYQRYFDSTVKRISGDMMVHLLKTTVDTLQFCGEKQQYQQTLYYYDLAGNLTTTVPPAGVVKLNDPQIITVKDIRKSTHPDNSFTHHKKESIYRYNSLNQLVYQHTPDGRSTYFFYDGAGRQVFSQNSKQRPLGLYTYSIYDGQGRPEESGELQAGCTYSIDPLVDFDTTYCTLGTISAAHPDWISQSHNEDVYPYQSLKDKIRSYVRKQVVETHYDEETTDLISLSSGTLKRQENLRSRVAAIQYYEEVPVLPALGFPVFSTYYSYDMGGNVSYIVYDYPRLSMYNQRFKTVDYDFDLISGKVNMISYNLGFPDQFYQQYDYDADNRITEVHTSNDGLIWNNDARYEYYKHGPLATLKVGNQKVQSLEYAYTIQGWLKAINGDVLNPTREMGENGKSGDMTYPADVMAHTLRYFKDDYSSISSTAVSSIAATATKDLHNGNISEQTTGIGGLGTMQRTYQYDQLQRLKLTENAKADDYAFTLGSPSNIYKSTYAYDPDGNIKKLERWDGAPGTPLQTDNFTYNYDVSGNNNKLLQVSDMAGPTSPPPAGTGGADLQPGQVADNYVYDLIGNLTEDKQGHQLIEWNRFGKVKKILNPPTGQEIHFEYDGKGNRIYKDVVTQPGFLVIGMGDRNHNAEYYVRDAGGNILATYHQYMSTSADPGMSIVYPYDTFSLAEHHIYGSSRLGVHRYDTTSLYNSMNPAPGVPPSFALNDPRPWYSYVFTDIISSGAREPYGTDGNTFLGEWYANRILGRRYYELSDHLGNVLATVLDRKTGAGLLPGSSGTLYDHWSADIASVTDYYPGGFMMPGRNLEHSWSRMGYNGQMKTDEVYGKGNLNTAKFWEYDTRIGRRWNLDPVDQISISNYAVNSLNPIWFKDPLGDKNDKDVKNNPNAPSRKGGTERFHKERMSSAKEVQPGPVASAISEAPPRESSTGWGFNGKYTGDLKVGAEYANLSVSVGKVGLGYSQGNASTILEGNVDVLQTFKTESDQPILDYYGTFPFDGKTKDVNKLSAKIVPFSASDETVRETALGKVTADYVKTTKSIGGLFGFRTVSNYKDALNSKSFKVTETFIGLDINVEGGIGIGGGINLRLGALKRDTSFGN